MDSGGLDMKMLRISNSAVNRMYAHPCEARIYRMARILQYSDRTIANRGHIPSAPLAVMCARWFVFLAHATIPGGTRQFIDLIAIGVIDFWFLNELA